MHARFLMSTGRCTTRLLLLLLIVLFLLSPSSAGGKRRLFYSNLMQGEPKIEVVTAVPIDDDAGEAREQRRVLRVLADDYSRYDPSPTMNKPHFKDIPN